MANPPGLLYHYTNQAGLLGILFTKVMWATRIHYLNDSTEFWHAFETAKRDIQTRITHTDEHERRTIEKLMGMKDDIESLRSVGTHVASFSGSRDSLGQWRGYVGSQPGYALGFDWDALREIAINAGAELNPCIYQPAEQERLIAQLITETMATDFDTSGGYIDPAEPMTIIFRKRGGDFEKKLVETAPLLKHPAFEDENEWRIVQSSRKSLPEFKYRPGQSMLIPYVELDLLQNGLLSCLKEIIVGPCPHPDLSRHSVDGLLSATKDLAGLPKVHASTASFRYW